MRPIDADALIENHFSDGHRIAMSYADKAWVRSIIRNEPTIDAVPVVRCRDCVHFEPFRRHDGFCKIDGMLRDNDFFCKCGKRREDGDV